MRTLIETGHGMRRTLRLLALSSAIGLSACSASAHELWFQPIPTAPGAVARLTFGDSPDAGEAERVAEIAHTRVWADGKPLAVKRLPDGLDATLAAGRPAILSAFADRGVINYMGDTFVIYLAAYSQRTPLPAGTSPSLGLRDDQLRLLLVEGTGGAPIVRATWKGEPVPDLAVQVFRKPGDAPTVVEMSGRGEMPCPPLKDGPVSLLAVVMDRTPGNREGQAYSHIRYKATLTVDVPATAADRVPPAECVTRVKEIHGGGGPWAVAGYRMGERALSVLQLPRQSFDLLVVHRCPAEVQYSCVADGLQASTGASAGKLNLKLEETSADRLATVVENRKTGRKLLFTLRPEFIESIRDLPYEKLEEEGRKAAGLSDDAMFTVSETSTNK